MFKTKGGRMLGKVLFEAVKFLGTALIITTIVDIILMGFLHPNFDAGTKHAEFFVSPQNETVKTE